MAKETNKTSKGENKNTVSKKVSDAFTQTIKNYLDSFANENPLFAEKYKNEKKSINECCGFICDEVRKMGVKGLNDDEVFYLARHYYEEEDVKGSKYTPSQVVVNHQVVLTEEEKKAAHDKGLKDFENAERVKLEATARKKAIEETKKLENAKKAEERKIQKEKEKAELEKKKQQESGQLNLYDLLELGGE